jgi:hypothetical protein
VCRSVWEVYGNRKELKRRTDLNKRFSEVFGREDVGHQALFCEPIGGRIGFTPRMCAVAELTYMADSAIMFSTVLKPLGADKILFACVTKTGVFSVLTVSFSEERPVLIPVSFKHIEHVEKCKFFGLSKQRSIVAYDGSTLTVMSLVVWIRRTALTAPPPYPG